MLLDVQAQLKRRISEGASALFSVTIDDPVIEVPKDLTLGDLATPVAFELAKRIKVATGEKRNPRELATALAEWLGDSARSIAGVAGITIAGAGYINVSLDRAAVLDALSAGVAPPETKPGHKILVEHTSVNPNKASHIGHMRNSVLGDSVVRILRATGHEVEVQNYIDNTGVQVADVVVGFLHVEPHTIDEVKAIPDPFDYYCWDLYSRVGSWYRDGNIDGKENPEKLKLRAEAQHEIESGHGPIAELAEYVAMRNLEALLKTNLRLGITYDVLPRESEVMQSNFWAEAFEMLKTSGVIYYAEEGRHAGCWVMKSDEESVDETEEQDEGEHAADKILVKSNGLVTYTGKDIAFHLWKLNRIDRDFDYRPFLTYPDGKVVWITTPTGHGAGDHAKFGHGARYVNVIDVGQSYTQDFVKRAVIEVTKDPEVATSTHLNYEKVGLTVAACDDLGLPLAEEERKRSIVSMSGRKGRGVKSDDLLDLLEKNALDEVLKRERGYSDEESRAIAHMIAIGAVRYFLLKFTRNSVIAFDLKEALSFTGETGPYIQNATVRLHAIFRKLDEAGTPTDGVVAEETARALLSHADNADFWPLLYLAAQLPDVLARSASALEPAHVAKYAFQLAQTMNEFYHLHPIKTEPDEDRRTLLIQIIGVVRTTLTAALGALGIDAPRRM